MAEIETFIEIEGYPQFKVGERVKVTQVRNCLFGYVRSMDHYVNCEVPITDMVWSELKKCYKYTLNYAPWLAWDSGCLEKIENANENFDVDNSVIDEFLSSFIK